MMRSSEIITIGRTKWALVFIAAFAVLYNITRFFEITWTLAQDPTDPLNATLRAELITTKLREDPIYISVYITGMYLVFMYTLPFSGLSILNYLIFVDVRKVRSNDRNVTLSSHQRKERKLAIMLMIVVLVFLICNVLPFTVNLMELFSISYKPLTEISNLLVTVNSSCNIFIYTIFGEKFQRQLCLYTRKWCLLVGDKEDDPFMTKSFYAGINRRQSEVAGSSPGKASNAKTNLLTFEPNNPEKTTNDNNIMAPSRPNSNNLSPIQETCEGLGGGDMDAHSSVLQVLPPTVLGKQTKLIYRDDKCFLSEVSVEPHHGSVERGRSLCQPSTRGIREVKAPLRGSSEDQSEF
eukprot:TCALIF_10326-PA protein Name:"Similar to FR FMRFamide receptor (Drosophila melanogaster)" AED:0.55 eAED:0.55 QI:0/0/0/0.4/0.75/0.8/5/0/350